MKLKDVKAAFNGCVSDENCQTILELVEGELKLDSTRIPEKFKGTIKWVDQCFSPPGTQALTMSALNDMIEGHGIEAIRSPNDFDEIIATYINTGDAYSGTIVYDHEYVLTTWGDWYEEWIQKQNEENDTVQCGHCSHLTPKAEVWSDTICENCQNNVSH